MIELQDDLLSRRAQVRSVLRGQDTVHSQVLTRVQKAHAQFIPVVLTKENVAFWGNTRR
jgi:hypothetical protein